jgi:septal ring factor EnvC (AmiA/AmiB activator)
MSQDSLRQEISQLISQIKFNNMKFQNELAAKDHEIRSQQTEINALKKQIKSLEEQLNTKHAKNERHAGRRKFDKKWTDTYMKFSVLMDQKKTQQEIMAEMGISRATYFRYKKVYSKDLRFDDIYKPDVKKGQ